MTRRRTTAATWTLALLGALSLQLALAAVPAYASVGAYPPSFVPGWDGVDDSTRITYETIAPGPVRVSIVDSKGRVLRVLVDTVVGPGAHETWWDGRDSAGNVLPPGKFVLRVEGATPDAGNSDEPGSANAGAPGTDTPGSADAVITLQQAPVAIRAVQLINGSIGATKRYANVVGRFNVTAPAAYAAAVVDGSGRIVRSLPSGTVAAGNWNIAWNGRTAAGKYAADGNYSLLVAASGAARPSNTLRLPIRIDRSVPSLVTRRATRAVVSRSAVTVPVGFRVSEAVTMTARFGSKRIVWKQAPGAKTVRLSGASLGLVPTRRARTVRLFVAAVDGAKNVRSTTTTVVVPGVAAPKPKPVAKPKPQPKPPTSKPSTGGLNWPTGSLASVTSKFGMRWGRMHQGIDIGVASGTPVHASAAGLVISAGTMDGYGTQVTIQHPNGMTTLYAHFTSVAAGLVAGDSVGSGQLIGLSGCTGSCTGPHVHFETRVGGIARNPLLYLPRS